MTNEKLLTRTPDENRANDFDSETRAHQAVKSPSQFKARARLECMRGARTLEAESMDLVGWCYSVASWGFAAASVSTTFASLFD